MTVRRSLLSEAQDLSILRVRIDFYGIPDRIHFGEIDFSQFFVLRLEFFLQPTKTPDEFVSGSLQHQFRVEFVLPRQINDREKQIANFIRDRR